MGYQMGVIVFNESCVAVSLPLSCPVAQKVVAMRKKQQLSIGPCKSLPNSPSHSSVPTASIPSVHLNQVRSESYLLSDLNSIKRFPAPTLHNFPHPKESNRIGSSAF